MGVGNLNWTVACLQSASSKRVAGSGVRNGFSSSRNKLIRLPSFFWKSLWLNSSSFSLIARFNSAREKNCSSRRAAVIHVDIIPTVPSHWACPLEP